MSTSTSGDPDTTRKESPRWYPAATTQPFFPPVFGAGAWSREVTFLDTEPRETVKDCGLRSVYPTWVHRVEADLQPERVNATGGKRFIRLSDDPTAETECFETDMQLVPAPTGVWLNGSARSHENAFERLVTLSEALANP